MAKFTYTYTLRFGMSHVLASGMKHIKELSSYLEDNSLLAFWRGQKKHLESKSNLSDSDQNEIILLGEAIEYAQGQKKLGQQLAADLNRVGFDLKEQPNKKGDPKASAALAEDFMKDLSYDQQLLVDQSQGLAAPTGEFLTKYLKFPNQKATLSPKMGAVRSTLFSKGDSLLKIDKTDHFYYFTNSAIKAEEIGNFFVKRVGSEPQMLSIGKNLELYQAIESAVNERAKEPYNPKVPKKLKITVEYPKGKTFEIEPIVSVKNTIRMGEFVGSLSWNTQVTTYSDKLKIEDGIFEENKKPLGARANQSTAQKMLEAIKNRGPQDYIWTMFWGGVVGTIIGFAVGGPIGAAVGAAIGVAAGGALETVRAVGPIFDESLAPKRQEPKVSEDVMGKSPEQTITLKEALREGPEESAFKPLTPYREVQKAESIQKAQEDVSGTPGGLDKPKSSGAKNAR